MFPSLCRPTFSYKHPPSWLAPLDRDSDWIVHLWFKNFFFTYEAEYLVCDWTCLVGEVGGNLGFFLGGSLLAFIDLIIKRPFHRV